MPEKLNIDFVPCFNFEMIKKLENCLLVFDDSCEEIYREREFVKIAVAGRHKTIHCIFVKHNLFHQSKWSRTIDFNTTHVLFKSPHDFQQFDHLGRQVNKWEFVRNCYQKATSSSYGHFFDWFRSKNKRIFAVLFQYRRGRSYKFLSTSFSRKRHRFAKWKKNAHILKHWQSKEKKNFFKSLLCECSADEVKFLRECALNVITEISHLMSVAYSPMKKSLKFYPMLRHVTRKDKFLPPAKGSNWCRRSVVLSTHI